MTTGPTSTGLSFAVSIGGRLTARGPDVAKKQVVEAVQRAEQAGIDMVTVADHIGAPAPFSLLALAAAVTERVRLRTYVLDAYFWNPALLAREVATLDALSGGRLELGIGAGHMRHEHDDARLPFPGVGERWAHVERVVAEVRRRLADPEHDPATVQRPVPVMVAAMGERGLATAARIADIVGVAGLVQVPGRPAGTFTVADPGVVDRRVAEVRQGAAEAGRPEPVLDALVQRVEIGDDPAARVAEVVSEAHDRGSDWVTAEMLSASPFYLFCRSAREGADELARRAGRWGITSWSTHGPSADAMMQVAAAHRESVRDGASTASAE